MQVQKREHLAVGRLDSNIPLYVVIVMAMEIDHMESDDVDDEKVWQFNMIFGLILIISFNPTSQMVLTPQVQILNFSSRIDP